MYLKIYYKNLYAQNFVHNELRSLLLRESFLVRGGGSSIFCYLNLDKLRYM
jgi:hypothetical protein